MTRQPAAPVAPFFTSRWSGRSFTGAPLPEGALASVLEAARWAPSSGNNQPWNFVHALAGTPAFAAFLDLLVPGNRAWCDKASALFVVASRTVQKSGKPARTHAFDTGAAWMSFALQAHLLGLMAHGMEGFDYDRAAQVINLPPDHEVRCMIALGVQGPREALPEPYRSREEPNDRQPVSAFSFEGRFPG